MGAGSRHATLPATTVSPRPLAHISNRNPYKASPASTLTHAYLNSNSPPKVVLAHTRTLPASAHFSTSSPTGALPVWSTSGPYHMSTSTLVILQRWPVLAECLGTPSPSPLQLQPSHQSSPSVECPGTPPACTHYSTSQSVKAAR